MDEIYNKIESIAAECNGFVKTSQIEAAGISRGVIKKYVDNGSLERVRKGIFVPADKTLMSLRCFRSNAPVLCFHMVRLFMFGD